MVQKKSTPFKKPKNKGGSPSGVKEPPILATRNIKKTTTWTLFLRCLFAFINGLISNIAAPVVPIQLAKKVPIKIIARFTKGVPTKEPVNLTPPDIVNSANNKIIKGIYSNNPTCNISYAATAAPSLITKGTISMDAQNKDILPKL